MKASPEIQMPSYFTSQADILQKYSKVTLSFPTVGIYYKTTISFKFKQRSLKYGFVHVVSADVMLALA
jgi:hypothetical protein